MINIDFSDKVALVTGAGAGIGAEIARWMGRAGAAVAVADVREDHAKEVVDSIQATGGHAVAGVADCRDEDQIDRMAADTVAALGGLDIAVNNIGMPAGRGGGAFVDMDGSFW